MNAASRAIGESSTTLSARSASSTRSSRPPDRSMLPALVPCGTEMKILCAANCLGVGLVRDGEWDGHETFLFVGEAVDAATLAGHGEPRSGDDVVVRRELIRIGDR